MTYVIRLGVSHDKIDTITSTDIRFGNCVTASTTMDRVVGLFFLLSLYQVDCSTTMPPTTTTTPVGCIIDGRHFQPGEEISRGKEGSWCFGSICNENGEVINWDDWNCNTEVTTMTTTQEPGTLQPGCYTGDRWIQLGEMTVEGRSGSWCYGYLCNPDGMLSRWDDWNCSS